MLASLQTELHFSLSRSFATSIVGNSSQSLGQILYMMLNNSGSLQTSIHRVGKGNCECVCVCIYAVRIYHQRYLQLSATQPNQFQRCSFIIILKVRTWKRGFRHILLHFTALGIGCFSAVSTLHQGLSSFFIINKQWQPHYRQSITLTLIKTTDGCFVCSWVRMAAAWRVDLMTAK